MTPEESLAWNPGHPDPHSSLDILPFFSEIAQSIPKYASCLEVGVYYGRSLAFLGSLRPDLTLYALDPWEGKPNVTPDGYQPLGCNYLDFVQTMQKQAPDVMPQVRVLRGYSQHLMKNFQPNSLDFVFIDGDHSPNAVMVDIEAAKRLIKKDGIIAGHDYCKGNGIAYVVDNAFPERRVFPWPLPHDGWFDGKSSCWWSPV